MILVNLIYFAALCRKKADNKFHSDNALKIRFVAIATQFKSMERDRDGWEMFRYSAAEDRVPYF
jgi:hypothetical protein